MPLFAPTGNKPPFGSQIRRSMPLARNMLIAIPFNEGMGLQALNPLQNDVWKGTTAGWNSQGVILNGSSNTLTSVITNNPIYRTYPFSVAARIYVGGGAGTNREIINFDDSANRMFQFRLATTNTLNFLVLNSPGASFQPTASATLSVGNWYTVVGTFDGVNINQYVNGTKDGTTGILTGTPFAGTLGPTTTIGNRLSTNYFNGQIDYIYYWGRLLAPGEIDELNDLPWSVWDTPQHYWLLGETDPISVNPHLLPANHNGSIVISLTGIGTNWISGTTVFTLSNGITAKVSQNIISTTAATVTVTTSSATGTFTISDGTNISSTITVSVATLSISPTFGGPNTSTTITATGSNTVWSTETASTLFTVSGVAGASITGISVTSNISATFTLNSAGAGSATISDSSTFAYNIFTIYPIAPGFTSIMPPAVPTNITGVVITLTGYLTSWSGSPFSISGVSGVTFTQFVTSMTSATITLTTSTTAGTLTISDGVYSITLSVNGPIVSQAYVGRSSQLAFFFIAAGANSSGSPPTVTSSVVGITITAGGLGYVSPIATISGGGGIGCVLGTPIVSGGVIVAIPVVNPGSSFTSAPSIVISDAGGGRGASATAILAGAPTAVTAVNSNPTIKVNGNTITIAGPTWTSTTHQWPFLVYQMLCGSVASVLVQTGGSGYTSPSASASGGGGTGLVLGTPVVANGVIAAIAVSGSATDGNAIKVVDNNGTGSGFVGYYTVSGGSITGAVIENGGSGYSTNLTVTTGSSNGTQSAVYGTVTIANNVVVSVPIVSPGSGYTSAPTITITGGGSGAVAVPIMSGPAPADTVTYSASSGWLTTAAGSIPAAASAPLFNFAGQLEPAFAQAPRTMLMGAGSGSPNGSTETYNRQQNWIKGAPIPWTGATPPTITITRTGGDTTGANASAMATVNSSGAITGIAVICGGSAYTATPTITVAAPPSGTTSTGWVATVVGGVITAITGGTGGSGYAGSTSDGKPISINGTTTPANISTGGIPIAYAQIALNGSSMGFYSPEGFPDQSGIWTFVADESNPSSPMVVSLYSHGVLVPLVAGYPTGTGIGKTWQWNVIRTSASPARLGITLQVAGPSASHVAPWTLANEFMAAPVRGTLVAQIPDRSTQYTPNPNFVNWVSGTANANFLRLSPFGNANNGENNVVDPGDLQPANAFSWFGVGNLSAVCVQIRTYQIWSGSPGYYSPYVWTSQNYPGTSAVASGPAAYAWTPPGNTSSNNVNWTANEGGNNTTLAAEIVTAMPHGFKTGQIVLFASGTQNVIVTQVNGSGTVTINFGGYSGAVWVTSATSFAVSFNNSSITSGPNVSNVDPSNASTVYNFLISSKVPSGGYALPYELLAAIVSDIPNCGLHVFIPMMATDATVTQIATTIRDIIPVGRQVLPEYTDEHWNDSYPMTNNMYLLAELCRTGNSYILAYSGDDFFALRQSQICDIFVSVFNSTDIHGNTNRGGSIVRAFGAQYGVGAANIISMANRYNASLPANPIIIDAIMFAPYKDIPTDASITAAAFSTYSNYPGSSQYQTATPWTMGMYADLVRHDMAFNLTVNSGMTFTISNLATYTPPVTQPTPYIIAYEGGPGNLVQSASTATDWAIRSEISYDLFYHPYFYDLVTGQYIGQQGAGFSQYRANELCYSWGGAQISINIQGNSDGYGVAEWLYTTWEGQTWGKGDGSIDGNGNPTVNQFYNPSGSTQDITNVSPKLQAWRDWAEQANGEGGSGGGIASLTEEQLASLYYAGRARRRVRRGGRIVGGMTVYYAGG